MRQNKRTGRVDFLYVEVQRNEGTEDTWDLVTTESAAAGGTKTTVAISPPSAALEAAQGAADAKPATTRGGGKRPRTDPEWTEAEAVTTAKGRGHAAEGAAKPGDPKKPRTGGTPPGDKTKEQQKELARAVAEANKVKQKFHETTSSISGLEKSVNELPEWPWLRESPTLLAPLRIAATDLNNSIVGDFARRFLYQTLKETKTQYDGKDLFVRWGVKQEDKNKNARKQNNRS